MADTTAKTTIWDKLAAGQLPSMDINTGVEVKPSSLVSIGLTLFVTFCLGLLAWYAFKKVTK